MRNARFSVLVLGNYLLVVGVSLFLIPTQFADLLGIDPPREVWVRVIGPIVVVLGVLYFGAVFNNARWMFRYSVFGRLITAPGFAYLAVVDGPWQLWIFAGIDVLGAAWTFTALRPRPVPTAAATEPTKT